MQVKRRVQKCILWSALWVLASNVPCFGPLPHKPHVSKVTRSALVVPSAALEGTRWILNLDIGRTFGSYMPLSWASDGTRLAITLLVEFCPGGNLTVHRTGKFLGQWMEPPEYVFGPAQLISGLQAVLPETKTEVTPWISHGKWEVAEESGGRLVKFEVETSGFCRETLWLPQGKLYFAAKAYGTTLSANRSTVFINESLFTLGAAAGVVLLLTFGPMCLLSLVFWAIGDVRIAVGTWSCQRVETDTDTTSLPPITYTRDEASSWQ